MKTLKNYLVILLGLSISSCTEEVIQVDLEMAEPRLVVDASIDWLKNTSGSEQTIKLTTTTAYYDESIPTVSGADVTVVANSSNKIYDFIERSRPEYICSDFEPIIGESYTLTISIKGETYTSTETLMGVPIIGDNIDQNNEGGMGADEVEITYYYQDDANEQNYYLYSVKNPRIAFPEYEVETDENNQGNLVPVYYSNKDLKSGDVLNIKLYGISRRYHEYFRKLLVASGADTGPFPTIPSAVRGNIINSSNPANYVYGYFRLSEVAVKDYTIQ